MRKGILPVAAALITVLNSCSSVYMPNVPSTPMLSAKGEMHAAGHISLRGNISFNSAYAVSDHVAVVLNGSVMDNTRTKEDFSNRLIEFGGGYFDTFGPDNNRILEVYGGYGKGHTDRVYRQFVRNILTPTDRQEVSFSKYFAQVNYSAKKKDSFRLSRKKIVLTYGTALRLSYITMNDFKRNELAAPKEDNIFLEPIFFTRMSLTRALQLQYTTSSNFGLRDRKFLTAGNSIFTIGAVLTIGGRAGKKQI